MTTTFHPLRLIWLVLLGLLWTTTGILGASGGYDGGRCGFLGVKGGGRGSILSKLDEVVDPTVIRQRDPNALVGYRGSLARVFKHKDKGGGPFDPTDFVVDAFIVSDKLTAQIGNVRFRDAGRIPILREAQSNIDTTLRIYPEFKGLRSDPSTFRVFTTKEWPNAGKQPFSLFGN